MASIKATAREKQWLIFSISLDIRLALIGQSFNLQLALQLSARCQPSAQDRHRPAAFYS